ncbi:MAG TPA: hypothetical protein VLL04_02760 [Rhizomicrobium sp.]|nr:hypothetical protein [Rhizomicrobium sp.]
MRAVFITLLLAATAVPGTHGQQSSPKPAGGDGTTHRTTEADCSCGTAYRTLQYWKLHRPSTQRERAETGRLNREFLAASRAAPLPAPPAPDPAQFAYQQQMKNYRALTDSYERRMRDYARLHANVPPAEETRLQDSARLDPYRGYNARGGNGY